MMIASIFNHILLNKFDGQNSLSYFFSHHNFYGSIKKVENLKNPSPPSEIHDSLGSFLPGIDIE
jgi:hypothetical protein